MKKFLVRGLWILLILSCVGAAYPAYFIVLELENESQGQIFGDFYTFDSKHIFSDYEKGKKDLFSVIPWEDVNDEFVENLPVNPPSNWKQQDYLDSLNIFHEIIFQAPFPRKIRGAIFFIPDCNQISFGPQNAVFFTSTISFPTATYYSYDINLKDGSITWHGNVYDPIISWPISSLDLSKNRITVEHALQIAEENGGEELRLANHNQCNIDIDISSTHRAGNWIVTYNSTIDEFTSLLTIEIDTNTGKHKVLAEGGAGYYTFDPQQINKSMSEGETDIFKVLTMKPENTLNLSSVFWTQEDYYKIAKAFNKLVLNENLDKWKIHSISFKFDCDDISFGIQQIHFTFWRINVLNGNYFVQDIIINPRAATLQWNNEYDYNINPFRLAKLNREMIDKSWIEVPSDEALRIVYQEEGKNLYEALKNSGKKCLVSGWLDNSLGSRGDTLEWYILEWKENEEASEERPDQLTAFVNIKTGKLYYFKHYYGNLLQ